MIELEKEMSYDDIVQWLHGGWCLYKKDSGDLVPARLSTIHPETSNVVMRVNSNNIKIPKKELHKKVFPHWPMCGALNFPNLKYAAYLNRRQQQLFRRTYNTRCLTLTTPKKWDVYKTIKGAQQLHPDKKEVVSAAFNPYYIPLNEIKEYFANGWFSVAINPRIIVLNTKPSLIYYRGTLAGKIHNTKLEIIDPVASKPVEKLFGMESINI